jgi:hypothetical protein
VTSGVYPRDTMLRPYHGLPRVRMVPQGDGTVAIVAVACSDCGCSLERSAKAVKLAEREDRGFTCKLCNALRTNTKRGVRRG